MTDLPNICRLSVCSRTVLRLLYTLYRGLAYLTMEQYERAAETSKRSVAHNPDAPHTHLNLAACLGRMGQVAPASKALAEAKRIFPGLSLGWVKTFVPYKRPADLALLIDGLRKAGLPE